MTPDVTHSQLFKTNKFLMMEQKLQFLKPVPLTLPVRELFLPFSCTTILIVHTCALTLSNTWENHILHALKVRRLQLYCSKKD